MVVTYNIGSRDKEDSLHSVGKSFVETVDLGRDAEVDGAITDFDNEAAEDVGVDLYQCQCMMSRKGVEGTHTLVTTLSFLPWLNSDLETAFSMR